MARTEILIDHHLMYALTSDETGQLFLEVAHGGIAMENLVLPLSREEGSLYKTRGKPVLDELAKSLLRDRKRYADRLLGE